MSRRIQQLLEKTTNYDKDERYMATSDLCTELQTDIKIEGQLEQKICSAIIGQLDDTSNDVQAMAVKCLSILVRRVDEKLVGNICSKLCDSILTGNGDLRDIYSIGLKTALADVPSTIGPYVARSMVSRILGGVKNDDNEGIKLECIDILGDLLNLYGSYLVKDHSNISTTALQQLKSDKPIIRKRASAALGQLAFVVSDELLDKIIKTLLDGMHSSDTRTYIHAVGTIGRAVGYRLGSHLSTIVPLFLANMTGSDDESFHNEASDEMRENILHAFEAFIIRCPYEITPHLPDILACCLDFLQYDPNYNYDTGEDEPMDEEEDYEEFDDADYSDDEDTSWKVRRAAVKALLSIVTSRTELLGELYNKCANLLLDRVKERDENVKLDVIECVVQLIKSIHEDKHPEIYAKFKCDVPRVLKISCRTLEDKKAIKAKVCILGLLSQTTQVLHGGLESHLSILIPHVIECCHGGKESSLILAALLLVDRLVMLHPCEVVQPYLNVLCTSVIACAGAEWYKIIVEALRVLASIVQAMRPLNEMADEAFDYKPFVMPIYNSILPRLQVYDIDQEIKEQAIVSMGVLMSKLGDQLIPQLAEVLVNLEERLRNETTRIAALHFFEGIASSPLNLDIKPVVPRVLNDLILFLKQQSRNLKQRSLSTLKAIVKSGSVVDQGLFPPLVEAAAVLISDQDLYLSQMAIDLCICTLQVSKEELVMQVMVNNVFPQCLRLASSSLIQRGETLETLLNLIHVLVERNSPLLSCDMILQSLSKCAVDGELVNTAAQSLGRCTAGAILAIHDINKRHSTIDNIVNDVESAGTPEQLVMIGLSALGEIGITVNLNEESSRARMSIFNRLDDKSCNDAVRSVAATALGNSTLGNMDMYLPQIMEALQTREEQSEQYLLLASLRQIIVKQGSKHPQSVPVQELVAILEKHCSSDEEGVRNMVAECLGKLAVVDPEDIVPYLAKSTTHPQALHRWTVMMSLKYAVLDASPVALLQENIKAFVTLLSDQDLRVRRAAITSFTSVAHHRSVIIREVTQTAIVPCLLKESRTSIQRTVDLGPFKHKVDDGLPIRKASFSCILTMLETMPEVFPVLEFLPYLAQGLGDVEDIQMLAHQIVAQIAIRFPNALLSELSTILDPLSASLTKPPPKTLGTHTTDVIRSTIRAIDAISSIPEAHGKLDAIVRLIQTKEQLREFAESDNLDILKITRQ